MLQMDSFFTVLWTIFGYVFLVILHSGWKKHVEEKHEYIESLKFESTKLNLWFKVIVICNITCNLSTVATRGFNNELFESWG